MYEVLPQQIIIRNGQLFAAINEELIRIIPPDSAPDMPPMLTIQQSRAAAKLYEKGHAFFQTTSGKLVKIQESQETMPNTHPFPIRHEFRAKLAEITSFATNEPKEIKPKKYAIPIRWDIYKFFHVEAPDLKTAIAQAWKTAEQEYLATKDAADDTLRIDDYSIGEQYPDEESNIDWTNYPT